VSYDPVRELRGQISRSPQSGWVHSIRSGGCWRSKGAPRAMLICCSEGLLCNSLWVDNLKLRAWLLPPSGLAKTSER